MDHSAGLFHDKFPAVPGPGKAGENWLWFVGYIASPISESVRLEDFAKTVELIGEALKWLCCFVQKYSAVVPGEKVCIRKPLSNLVWDKYTGMCYACSHLYTEKQVKSKRYLPCICSTIKAQIERREKFFSEKTKERNRLRRQMAKQGRKPKPSTLDQWAQMIKTVYGPAHFDMQLSAICLHFIEEVGEVSRAIRKVEEADVKGREWKICMSQLEEELADVFSWIFGLFNKVNQYIGKAKSYYLGRGLSEAILPEPMISELADGLLKSAT